MSCLHWLECPTLEMKWIMSSCCCGFRGASLSKKELVLIGGWRSLEGDVWEEDMSGTDPGAGVSGSLITRGCRAGDGQRRYGFRVLPTSGELLTWTAEARDFVRAS